MSRNDRQSGFRQDGLLAPLAVGAAISMVAVALIAAGVIPWILPGTRAGAAIALTFSGARTRADPTVAFVPGGPWTLIMAQGYFAKNGSFPWNPEFLGCLNTSDIQYYFANPPGIPAFTGGPTSGLTPFWLFDYKNATTMLFVVVVNGLGVTLAKLPFTGFRCGPTPKAIPNTGIIDSPSAVSGAVATNASFFGLHTELGGMVELVGGCIAGTGCLGPPPEWVTVFTTCPTVITTYNTGSAYVNGTAYEAILSASTGSVNFFGEYNQVCSSPNST